MTESNDETTTEEKDADQCELPECNNRGAKPCRDPEGYLLDLCPECRSEWPAEVIGQTEPTTDDHPFDVAKASDKRVNKMLADTDGAICTMEYTGSIGYHINVAKGESEPEYIWKIALLQALDESVFEMMHVDEPNPEDARWQLERQLEDTFNSYTAERIADRFEEKLRNLIQTQEKQSEA